MYRLIWVFAGHTGLVGFVVHWLKWNWATPWRKKTFRSYADNAGMIRLSICTLWSGPTMSAYCIYPIGSPQPYLTILVLKFEKIYFTTCWCVYNSAGWVANSVASDQTLHSAVSDLGLHCLLRTVCSNTYGYHCTLDTWKSSMHNKCSYQSLFCWQTRLFSIFICPEYFLMAWINYKLQK